VLFGLVTNFGLGPIRLMALNDGDEEGGTCDGDRQEKEGREARFSKNWARLLTERRCGCCCEGELLCMPLFVSSAVGMTKASSDDC